MEKKQSRLALLLVVPRERLTALPAPVCANGENRRPAAFVSVDADLERGRRADAARRESFRIVAIQADDGHAEAPVRDVDG